MAYEISHKIGSFQWQNNPRHAKAVEKIDGKGIAHLERCLAELPKILGESESWVLSGGLAIPTTYEGFYRVHRDIDIGMHETDLAEVAETAESNGYGLFSRAIMFHTPKKRKIDLYEKVTVEKAVKGRRKNLRLVRVDRIKGEIVRHEDLLDYFDIYLHHFVGGDLFSNEDGVTMPSYYHFGDVYYTVNRQKIRVRSLRYMEIIKKRRMSEVDRVDLKVLQEAIAKKRIV